MGVYIDEEDIKEVESFVNEILTQKLKEDVYKADNKHAFKRWKTGILGELVIEKKLQINFRDNTIGISQNYAYPDMKAAGYNIGIKTCQYPLFPVINRNIKDPQIFVLLNKDYSKAIILGLADIDLIKENLNNKENDKLIRDKDMLNRKTAFSLIEKLKPITNIKDLSSYKMS